MTILLNNLRRIFGKPLNIILMIVVPIVLNLFFIAINSEEAVYNVGVVDCDDSELTKILLDELDDRANLVYFEDEEDVDDEIKSALLNSEIDMALRFGEKYEEEMIAGKAPKIEIGIITETNQSEPIKLLVSGFAGAAQQIGKECGGDREVFFDHVEEYAKNNFKAEYEAFEFTKDEKINRAVSSLGYLAMGMMFLMSFATTLLLEDKVTRVYARLITTPVTRASYLIQHLLSYLLVAAIQIVAILNLIPLIADISFGEKFSIQLQVMLVTMIFATACVAIGLTISRFSKNNVVAGAFVGLINLPVLMLGGCMWPMELMPEALQKVGDFMPTTWFLKAAEEVLYGRGLGEAAPYLLYLGALAVVLLTVSFVVKTDDKC